MTKKKQTAEDHQPDPRDPNALFEQESQAEEILTEDIISKEDAVSDAREEALLTPTEKDMATGEEDPAIVAEAEEDIPVADPLPEPVDPAAVMEEGTAEVQTIALLEQDAEASPQKTEATEEVALENPLAIDLHEMHDGAEEEDEEGGEEEEPVAPEERFETYSREALVETLEETVKESDVQKIKGRVALIKVAFLKLTKESSQKAYEDFIASGGEKEDFSLEADPLSERFNQAFEIYRKNKARYNEEQEVLKLRNLDAKKQILEELKELINSDQNLKKTYDTFKDLQQKWKDTGLVPSGEINNLWQSYHFLVEKFFDKVKISKELRDLDLKKNLEHKIELCEKAEELLLEPSIVKSFKQLQKYHEEWKEIGPVTPDKKDEIWERFKTATDKINDRRRDHYASLADSQQNNLLAKSALCEKVELIVTEEAKSIKDWQQKTSAINELFKVWKSIGPAPKKDNDAIWERFKTSLNAFFANKKEYFGQIKQEQMNNYNLKLNIVRQAEALRDSTDWKKTTQELISLQREWKDIGPVPRKYSDKVWKKFRAACDEFFKNKASFFSNIDDKEKDNLLKKRDLIKRVEEYKFDTDKTSALEVIKGFQREWTEIGHVPIREKDKIHDAFREAINKHLDNLNISATEMRSIDYKTHIDHLKEIPNASRVLRKEMIALSVKVTKLREEIHLWENNIGFLAHSKKADLLKQEFEKKIEKAKEELAFSEAKLRYMQQSLD
jgi:hypothetical protein